MERARRLYDKRLLALSLGATLPRPAPAKGWGLRPGTQQTYLRPLLRDVLDSLLGVLLV